VAHGVAREHPGAGHSDARLAGLSLLAASCADAAAYPRATDERVFARVLLVAGSANIDWLEAPVPVEIAVQAGLAWTVAGPNRCREGLAAPGSLGAATIRADCVRARPAAGDDQYGEETDRTACSGQHSANLHEPRKIAPASEQAELMEQISCHTADT
jgi:hypothetical protein